jgi:predicted GNAT family N-acyltransferase
LPRPAEAAAQLHTKVVSNAEELAQVFAVRAAVYMSEQQCPYEEEFDGNDYSASHILGMVDDRPVGCVRIRWFAGFAKGERMTVLRQYRGCGIGDLIARRAFELVRRKGYSRYYVHAQRRLVHHWASYGMKPKSNRIFHFSDHEYVAMVMELPPAEDALTEDSDPLVLLRPEDDFDHPGVLERSAVRPPTNPIGGLQQEPRRQ